MSKRKKTNIFKYNFSFVVFEKKNTKSVINPIKAPCNENVIKIETRNKSISIFFLLYFINVMNNKDCVTVIPFASAKIPLALKNVPSKFLEVLKPRNSP